MKTLKKIICIALAFTFMACPVYAADEAKSFPDVPENNWAYKYIMDLTEAGVINGFPDGTFHPKNEITYDEFAALAVRACEAFDADVLKEKYSKETVEGYNWASIYHFYARDNSFYAWEDALGGISESAAIDGTKPCTRADAAAIISDVLVEDRGLNLDVMLLSNLEDAYHDSISELFGNPYEDWAGTDKYNDDPEYRTEYAVVNTIAHGIINGYPDATFRGDNKITREEAAAMIWRLIYTDYAPGATALTYDAYMEFHPENSETLVCKSYSGKEACVNRKIAEAFFYDFNWKEDFSESEIEEMMLYFVNFERRAEGLSELKLADNLIDMAMFKAKDMKENNYYSHESEYEGDIKKLIRKYIPNHGYAGENIAYGPTEPLSVYFNGWMDSKGHRDNILYPHYKYFGFGYYGAYYSQEFSDTKN